MPSNNNWSDSMDRKTSSARVYVDPWDLENYAFMRRHLEMDQQQMQTQVQEYKVPLQRTIPSADSPTLFANIDELDFHNDNFDMETSMGMMMMQQGRKMSTNRQHFGESGSSLSSGAEHSMVYSNNGDDYIYAPATRVRKMTRSKAPPAEYLRKMRNMDCPECQMLESEYLSQYELDMQSTPSSDYVRPPPEHFGLSPYGHLKIDYSCSWHSLDKIISNEC